MHQLSTTHKEFIVKQLACFERPSEIVRLVKEQFGVDLTRQQVSYYNPETSQGSRELAAKWRHLFEETRTKFIEGAIDIPVAHKTYRLRELQTNYEALKRTGKIMEACQTLEQAAKEVGGAFQRIADKVAEQSEGHRTDFYQQINQKIIQIQRDRNPQLK